MDDEDCLVCVLDDDVPCSKGILRGNGDGPPLSEDSLVDVDVDVAVLLLLLLSFLLPEVRAMLNR